MKSPAESSTTLSPLPFPGFRPMYNLQGRMMRPLSDIYEIIERLAQMMIVTRCRCSIRRSKSESHLNCFHMDSWIQEEFRNCVDIAKEIEAFAGSRADNDSPDFPMYAESLDSLQAH